VKQRLRSHDLSVLTEAALRYLLVNPRLLDGVEGAILGQAFESGDLGLYAGDRCDAGPRGGSVDDDGARSALAESAAEARTLQAEIVAKDVEERSGWIDIDGVRTTVHLQCNLAHALFSFSK